MSKREEPRMNFWEFLDANGNTAVWITIVLCTCVVASIDACNN